MRRTLKAILIGGCLAVAGRRRRWPSRAAAAAAACGGGGVRTPTGALGRRSYDPAAEYAKAIAALKANQYKDAARAAEHVTDAVPEERRRLAPAGRGQGRRRTTGRARAAPTSGP